MPPTIVVLAFIKITTYKICSALWLLKLTFFTNQDFHQSVAEVHLLLNRPPIPFLESISALRRIFSSDWQLPLFHR